ncbi:MAG TPA: hypothetical protein VLD64_04110, partial [Nitrosarchaeum sp.]|nr:hypothetical protein [Nitrosarchaeum sp.]
MNTKTLLGLSFAAIFTVSMMTYAFASPSWTTVTDFNKGSVGNIAVLQLTTGGNIPHRADSFVSSNAVVGFAWADLDTAKLVVATIHPVLGRDSHQNPDAWHIHTATLTSGANGHPFCLASVDSTPEAGVSINQDSMVVRLNSADLPYALDDIDGAVGFTLNGEPACPPVPGLGIGV